MLAFIVNQFPRQVDAYFLRELRGLLESGLDFGIYSLLPAPKGWKIHEDARPLLERTIYPPAPTALGGQTLAQLARHPAQTAGIAARVAAGHRSMPAALAKSMAILPQSLAFAREMQERGVRHIHANWATYPATAAMVISELTGLPYSFSGHATDIFVHHAMLREKIEAAQFVITCTKFNRTYLAEIAPEHADRIRTVYHGVDLPAFAPTGAPRHPRLVLSAGTLRTCKGYDDLIRAIGLLRDRGSDAELEIVGEGEERSALENLISSLNLGDRVRLPGYRPQEELIPAYQTAAVVALPAHHEDHFGIPNILIEGLAAGAPVVCTELPSLAELVEHGASGLFVPERDPAALADALGELLADPERADRMAKEGRRRVVEHFDMEQTVAELVRTFRTATQKEAA
ncbi:MAG: glycosyltransferase family 4 protein [Candidatus Binatia bacterium]|nr:glycosyltransferase family 4 protein [Candidatus Binatia bacterium]